MVGRSRFAIALLVATATFAACSRKRPAPAPEPTVGADTSDAERARRDSIARAEAARRDSLARTQSDADRMRAEREAAANLRNTLLAKIFFEFDSDALTAQATEALNAKLAILSANPRLTLRIAGHADERGSDEYNLALGQRRAAAAKRYLTQRGIAEDRIEVISYGEERPAVPGHDESAWAQNRRDEFEIIAGGDQLTAPARQ
jgi:peptidoglycan-associated lipoprotein